jgi:hypothetical protein
VTFKPIRGDLYQLAIDVDIVDHGTLYAGDLMMHLEPRIRGPHAKEGRHYYYVFRAKASIMIYDSEVDQTSSTST